MKNKKCETYKNTGVLIDPASMHILVLKIKPCKSKCFVFVTLDCGPLIITGKIEIIFLGAYPILLYSEDILVMKLRWFCLVDKFIVRVWRTFFV